MFSALRKLIRRLRVWFDRDRYFADMDEEMRHHAELAGRRGFGNPAVFAEQSRAVWIAPWFESLLQDAVCALRSVRRERRYAVIVTAGLALGVALSTSLFSFVNAFALRPLPVRAPERTVRLAWEGPSADAYFTYAAYETLRSLPVWEQLAAEESLSAPLARTASEESRGFTGFYVSGNYFTALSPAPALAGRLLTPADDQPGAPLAVVLSESSWSRHFHRDSSLIGARLLVRGTPATVVGVAPAGFTTSPISVHFYLPLSARHLLERAPQYAAHRGNLRLLGLLRPDMAAGQARAAVESADAVLLERPRHAARQRLAVHPARFLDNPSEFRPFLVSLLGIAAVILAIACANLTNLMLARGEARRRELAVRLATGASRGRIVRQLVIESLVFTSLAGIAGTILAWRIARYASSALTMLVPDDAGVWLAEFSIDLRVLLFVILVSLGTGVAFGIVPSLRVSRFDIARSLKAGGDSDGAGVGRSLLRDGLIVAQLALCSLLLCLCWIFVGGAAEDLTAFEQTSNRRVLTVYPQTYMAGYGEAQVALLQRSLAERLAALPGVVAATIVSSSGPSGHYHRIVDASDQSRSVAVSRTSCDPRCAAVLGLELLQGRMFSDADAVGSERAALIADSAARQLWPGNDAGVLGRRIRFEYQKEVYTIVGVIRGGPTRFQPSLVTPLARDGIAALFQGVMLRTAATTEPEALRRPAIAAVRELAPGLDAVVRTFDEEIGHRLTDRRVFASVAGVVALAALFLAGIGLYGVTAYVVSRRTRELGIRVALGARGRSIFGLVMRRGAVLTGAGALAGLALAAGTGRLIRASDETFPGVDTTTLAVVTLLLTLLALVSMIVPARRATRVDPLRALRHD